MVRFPSFASALSTLALALALALISSHPIPSHLPSHLLLLHSTFILHSLLPQLSPPPSSQLSYQSQDMPRRLSHEDDPSPLLALEEEDTPSSPSPRSFRPSFSSASFKRMFGDRSGSRMTLPTFIKDIRHKSTPSVRWGLILTGVVSMMLLVSYMISLSYHRNNYSQVDITVSAKWPHCPVPANAEDVCINTGVNLTDLASVCGTLEASIGHCQDRLYGVIVAPMHALDTMSRQTYKLILEGSDIGTDLDSYVQSNSRWMINTMAPPGYETLFTYDDEDRIGLHHDLDQLQNRCERFYSGAYNPVGFGSKWHLLGLGLAVGLHYDMTLLTPEQPKSFISMTTCTIEQMEKAFAEHPPEKNYHNWDNSTINYESPWRNGNDVWDLLTNRTMIETKYEPRGFYWWRSMLTYYVARPNAHMRQIFRDAPQFPKPCIGIHVRHSDKGSEARLLDLSMYMKKAKKYRSKTGISNVYLMTDDEEVIEQTKNYPDFQFHYRDAPRSNKGWKDDLGTGYTYEEQETNFLLDIYTVVQCQKLIVTYSSNVGRLMSELSFAIHNKEPDLDSLDEQWGMFP